MICDIIIHGPVKLFLALVSMSLRIRQQLPVVKAPAGYVIRHLIARYIPFGRIPILPFYIDPVSTPHIEYGLRLFSSGSEYIDNTGIHCLNSDLRLPFYHIHHLFLDPSFRRIRGIVKQRICTVYVRRKVKLYFKLIFHTPRHHKQCHDSS